MSVKFALMALMDTHPMYGAQLRAEFEERTGGTWPLNVGQVYTTLGRLERDGLVESSGIPDDEGRIPYQLTDHGRTVLHHWWDTPVDRQDTPRDELVIKLALAVTLPGVDVSALVQQQRTATLRHLQDLTRLKRADATTAPPDQSTPTYDLSWHLVLDHLIFADEAEIRWLDHVESTLARAATHRQTTSTAAPYAPAPSRPLSAPFLAPRATSDRSPR
ncbi:hypothetical protein KEM60_00165 [Austwickia sp. TVS 96-490-7B]|uniref:PadR family transcriptional regulator n=1 Tax=Austwickia sp. TVS 96-490-7B TaxID=2830843 RepID=UPI001C577255|nr:PadR family transcriptional regulator [Austwickia sp. TVS 96-490-7B]MBW3083982.1 hypothetical protein [Austwickia sp. TVS 96-490-7B]